MLYTSAVLLYVWDLCYPRQYQILLFLQLYLDDKDKAGQFKSANYLKFEMFLAQIQRETEGPGQPTAVTFAVHLAMKNFTAIDALGMRPLEVENFSFW